MLEKQKSRPKIWEEDIRKTTKKKTVIEVLQENESKKIFHKFSDFIKFSITIGGTFFKHLHV